MWLKTCRVRFEDFAGEVCRLETLITRPSEIGKEMGLSFATPLIFVDRDEARFQVSYGGLENETPYGEKHMGMQGSDEGCVRYLVKAAPKGEEGEMQDEEMKEQ